MSDLQKARLMAGRELVPYMVRMVMGMVPVKSQQVPYMATDCLMRLYYNEEELAQHPLEENAWVIVHEVLHVFGQHARRREAVCGQKPDPEAMTRWNWAADLAINSMIHDMDGKLPEGCLVPGLGEFAKYPPHLTAEEYYRLLEEDKTNVMQPSYGGSSADGEARPWDLDETHEGYGDAQQERIRHAVAKEIAEHAKKRGNVPAGLERIASQILKPRFDPRKELMTHVRYAVNSIKGWGHVTWKRPSRRPSLYNTRLPSQFTPVPKPLILVDTSGSMGDTDLGLALGVIADVVKALPSQDGVNVVSGDTELSAVTRFFSDAVPAGAFVGGGGTDMGRLMVQAYEKYPQTDVILVVTDGYTPWPAQELPVRCLALISGECEMEAPKWIKRVNIR